MSVLVQHVSKQYGSFKAVKNISFTAEKGRITGLLGPNGAGKSTTMKMITGFLKPDHGIIKVCDIEVSKAPIQTKSLIGYLPENNPLYTGMYIAEYLQFLAGIYSIQNKASRIEEVIQLTGLELERNKKIHELSKGYRQRVGLAQALLHNPEVLILDEPTSGLDPNQLIEVRKLIKDMARDKTVILSTHIMQEVQSICDDVIILNRGEIVAMDKLENLSLKGQFQSLKVTFKYKLDSEVMMDIAGIAKLHQIEDNSFEVYYDLRNDVREAIFDKAVELGNPILEMKLVKKSMESIFGEFTGGAL